MKRFVKLIIALLLIWGGNVAAATVRTIGYNDPVSAVIDKSKYDEVLEAEDLVRQGRYSGSVYVAPNPYQYMIWMVSDGSRLYGTFAGEGDVIAVQFAGSDSNDGTARIYIDGAIVAEIDSRSQGSWYVEISDIPKGRHSVIVEARRNASGTYHLHIDALALRTMACMQPPMGMIGWWPGDGSAADRAGTNHGALMNGAGYAEGKVEQSFSLSAPSYVRVPDSHALDTPDGFTADAWIYPTARNGAKVIASKWDDPTGQWSWIFKLHNDGSGRLRIEISNGNHNSLGDLRGTSVLPLNTWSHVAATYDRATSKLRLYVNGSLDSEGSARYPGTAINNSQADILIGAGNGKIFPSAVEHFAGRIDELELFDRALTPEEIAALYLAAGAGKCKPSNVAPAADAGPDRTVECAGPDGNAVTLDGSGSSDPDGDELTYTWTWSGGTASGVSPSVTLPLGAHAVTLTVDDGKGGTATDEVTVTVRDTTPPVTAVRAIAGIVGDNGWYTSDVLITVDSIDSCSGVRDIGSAVDGSGTTTPGATAAIPVQGDGRHTVTFGATDNAGNSEPAQTLTINIDTTTPTADLSVAPGVLWPPNHKMVDVQVSGGSADGTSGVASIVFTVTDEYGTVQPEISGFNTTIPLEAWREGTDKDGRRYTITAVITDTAGNTTTVSTEALCPHDRGDKK